MGQIAQFAGSGAAPSQEYPDIQSSPEYRKAIQEASVMDDAQGLQLQSLNDLELQELDGGHRWYKIDPTKVFNAKWNGNKGGACAGNWFAPEFLQSPYITKDGNSVSAHVTGKAVNHHACIFQHTNGQCNFFLGNNGVSQLEFDYEVTGDPNSNWFSFWLNPQDEHYHWVKDVEIDSIENMWHSFAHNFAGLGHQVHIPGNRRYKGHATTYLQDTGVQVTNCDHGQQNCQLHGDYANKKFSGSSVSGIRAGKIKHHLYIDYWKTQGASSLKVSNIRVKAGGAFNHMCPHAVGI